MILRITKLVTKEIELYGVFNSPQSYLFYKYLNIYP